MQKEVYTVLGLKPSHYNKIEKGLVEPSIEILGKIANYYGITIDQLLCFNKSNPIPVIIEDKSASEQIKLISQLNEKDKGIVMNIIETMLTKQKFQDFFEQNLQPK